MPSSRAAARSAGRRARTISRTSSSTRARSCGVREATARTLGAPARVDGHLLADVEEMCARPAVGDQPAHYAGPALPLVALAVREPRDLELRPEVGVVFEE